VPAAKRHLLGFSVVGQVLHYHQARHVIPLLLGPKEAARLDIDALADHIAEFSLAAVKRLYPAKAHGART
jgi:hypothetical protein